MNTRVRACQLGVAVRGSLPSHATDRRSPGPLEPCGRQSWRGRQPSVAPIARRGAVAALAAFIAAWGISATGQELLTIAVLPPPSMEVAMVTAPANAATLKCELPRGMPLPLSAVAFSPDGKTLAVGGLGEVLLWDLAEGKLARRIQLEQDAAMVQAVAFAKDGGFLAAGQGVPYVSGSVTLLDLHTGQPIAKFQEPKGPVNCLTLSPDGKRLAAGCGDAAAYVWSLDDKHLIATLKDHALPILSAAFGADGKYLVTGGADAKVQTWNTETWQPDLSPTMVGGEVRRATIRRSQVQQTGVATHTFVLLIGGREDRTLRVVLDGKAQWWQRKAEYHARVEPGLPLDWAWLTKGSQKTFVACSDGTIKVFGDAAQRLTHTATLRGHADWVYGLAVSADQAQLASASGDGTVKLWSTADERLLGTLVQLAPRSGSWLIVARDGWFAASTPEAVTWKTAGLDAASEQLAALHNPDAVRQVLSGKPPAAPPLH